MEHLFCLCICSMVCIVSKNVYYKMEGTYPTWCAGWSSVMSSVYNAFLLLVTLMFSFFLKLIISESLFGLGRDCMD